jgi:hypothetical protein
VHALVDGALLGVFPVACRSGMAGLQTGWNEAAFDDFGWLPSKNKAY